MITLELPYPPSVNHYWRYAGRHLYLSREGRNFRERVTQIVLGQEIQCIARDRHLFLSVTIHPPDRRRRDIDNILKGLLDAMQHARLYEDDSQIKKLLAEMREPVAGGKILATIEEMEK